MTATPTTPIDTSEMTTVHSLFRREFRLAGGVVRRVEPGDVRRARVVADHLDLLTRTLHHHHTGEDTYLWPFLMGKVGPEERSTLEAMEAEHAQIDPGLQACAAGFARLAKTADPDARAALAVRLTAVREALGRHLHHEESDTILLMQQVMTAEEWEEVDSHFKEGVTFGQVLTLIPWVMHGVPAEARPQIYAHTGPAYRVLLALTRPRFDRLHRKAFKHLPGA